MDGPYKDGPTVGAKGARAPPGPKKKKWKKKRIFFNGYIFFYI